MNVKIFHHLISFTIFTRDMAVKGEKKYQDPEIGEVTFRKNTGSSRMSIKVHPLKGVSVTVPYVVPYAAAMLFFQARRDWVLETMARQKERYKDIHIPSEEEIESLRRQARKELPPRLAVFAERYGFRYNRVTIKHNATNWGSCSAKGNINLNLNIIRLPAVLQDYVLLHELCHLRHQDHGQAFHLLLEHVLYDNILKLIDAGDETALGLARKAAASKASHPLEHVMTREIKNYGII